MKLTKLTITIEKEKLDALELYAQEKNINVEEELSLEFDKLFRRVVPRAVQNYIIASNKPRTPSTNVPTFGRTQDWFSHFGDLKLVQYF